MLEFFPYDSPRNIQIDLIKKIDEAVSKGRNIVIHAPTGLGKTVASMVPTIKIAKKNKKKIFFLTSRHSQHQIAIETVEAINKKGHNIKLANIIGKKFMCLQKNVEMLSSYEFTEFCSKLKEDEACEFYSNTFKHNEATVSAKKALDLIQIGSSSKINQVSNACNVCPYEIAILKSKEADIIVADYYYFFNPSIRTKLLGRLGIELNDCIVIVDEAHNLPERIKGLMSDQLSKIMLERASSEAKKYEEDEAFKIIDTLHNLIAGMNSSGENLVLKEGLIKPLSKIFEFDLALEALEMAAERVREKQNRSYIGSIATFLEMWNGQDNGFARIINTDTDHFILKYQCLDPSLVSSQLSKEVYSMILMSGTLSPVSMYSELLGIYDSINAEFPSPFPENNKLSLIVPKTSTKFTTRNDLMYKQIADTLKEILDKIPGNTAVFFPSYYVKDMVKNKVITDKTVFDENSAFSTEDKKLFINNFRDHAKRGNGAVLYGIMGGNFSEGVDLPGSELHGVIIVGLPLTKPDLETDELIKYYDGKFGKGREYGYVFPAFNKTLQSAGRCIRSESDRGVIIFLDERYLWSNYYKCFPSTMRPRISMNYAAEIEGFFNQ